MRKLAVSASIAIMVVSYSMIVALDSMLSDGVITFLLAALFLSIMVAAYLLNQSRPERR